MNSQPNAFEELRDRILKLEKQNRRLKHCGVAVLIIPALVLVMGQVPSKKAVEANEFILRDDAGRVRAKLWMSTANENVPDINFRGKPSPTLALFNEQGKITVAVKAGLDSLPFLPSQTGNNIYAGSVAVFDNDGHERGVLMSASGYGTVDLRGPTEKWGALLYPSEMIVTDGEGSKAVVGTMQLVEPNTGKTQERSAASLLLFDKNNHLIWRAP